LKIDTAVLHSVTLFTYALPFKTPLQSGNRLLTHREGILIKLTNKDGFSGFGEIAPLDGYSEETTAQALAQIKEWNPTTTQDLYPSVRFGIETAFHNLTKKKPSIKASIPINALLLPDHQRIEAQVQELLRQGFRTIKIKVGRSPVSEDIEAVNRTAAVLPQGVRIRLDANQMWREDQALTFGKAVESSVIEYIEEPFNTIAGIPRFYKETGIKVALDESLRRFKASGFPQGVGALVLKPTILGGIDRTRFLIALAQRHKVTPVISSCFEAGPGFAQLLELAASLKNGVCGLDTLKYLETNLLPEPVKIIAGSIQVPEFSNFEWTKTSEFVTSRSH